MTGTTIPTNDGLDHYFEQNTVLHTPSCTPVEEPTGMDGRHYIHGFHPNYKYMQEETSIDFSTLDDERMILIDQFRIVYRETIQSFK